MLVSAKSTVEAMVTPIAGSSESGKLTEKIRVKANKRKRGIPTPVVFQTLEEELKPVLGYLQGAVLNAGSGSRDITEFLLAHGATSVDNCDVHSAIPNAIIADLTSIPRQDATYDAILCNAVLEHVQYPDRVVQELRRLLKPNGYLVLCIPFMQPNHPCPDDYRRYSRQGMLELARVHDLEVVDIHPVHTVAQTVTWIWWAHLEEQDKRLQQILLWVPFHLWCRLSRSTDFSFKNQANSFQAILRKNG